VKWKKESGNGGQYRGDQEPFGPNIEAFTADHTEQHDQAGENRCETDEGVNDCIDVQDHYDPITSVIGDRKARLGPTASRLRRR